MTAMVRVLNMQRRRCSSRAVNDQADARPRVQVQSGLQDGDLHVKLGHCAVATPASGSYLPQSRYNPSELLRGLTLEEQLVIPAMSIHASAATLKLSAVEVEELDTTLTAASVTLTEAAALLIKAAGTAGGKGLFAAPELQSCCADQPQLYHHNQSINQFNLKSVWDLAQIYQTM